MLLNLNPLPANLPVAAAPAAAAPSDDGFQAVMSRRIDGILTAGEPVDEGGEFNEAMTAPVMVGEIASTDEQALDEIGSGGMEALIGEMLQRQDVAAAEGSSLPLVDALEALANAIEDFSVVVTNTPVDVPAETAVGPADDAVADNLPESWPAELGTIAEEVASIVSVITRASPTSPEAVSAQNLPRPDLLVSTLRDLVSRLRSADPGPSSAATATAATAQPLKAAIGMTDAAAVIPAEVPPLEVEDGAELDMPALREMVESVRLEVERLAQRVSTLPALVTAGQSTDPLTRASLADLAVTAPEPELVVPAADARPGEPEPAALSVSLDRLLRQAFAGAGPQVAREQNPVVSPDRSLLDPEFSLSEYGSRVDRDLTISQLSVADPSKATLTPELRVTVESQAGTQPVPMAANDKAPGVDLGRQAVVTGKAEVWLQQPVELPEHIVEHVNRLHAQSLRLHAAGFTDLVQRLTLSVYPEDLGQVDVQMRTGEQMNLTFFAREAATRDLLEQNLPRLRQLFESQGLSLGDVNVGAGQAQDRQSAEEGRQKQAGTRTGGDQKGSPDLSTAELRRGVTAGRGLIDVLA